MQFVTNKHANFKPENISSNLNCTMTNHKLKAKKISPAISEILGTNIF